MKFLSHIFTMLTLIRRLTRQDRNETNMRVRRDTSHLAHVRFHPGQRCFAFRWLITWNSLSLQPRARQQSVTKRFQTDTENTSLRQRRTPHGIDVAFLRFRRRKVIF